MMIGRGMIYGGGGGDGDARNEQKSNISSRHQPFDSMLASVSSNSFTASSAMVNFGASSVNTPMNLFNRSFNQEEISGDEYLDEYFNHPEKKRRLTVDQVQFLEKSFEAENKLERERKSQLATELGLQPRQIAIWFQNRRARLRTKRVETDYEMLCERYNCLKTDHDNVLKENEKLKLEVFHLKENAVAGNREKRNSLCVAKTPPESLMQTDTIDEVEGSVVLAMACRDGGQSETRSDSSTGTDSLCYINGIHSPLFETGISSHVLEPDHSDFSEESLKFAYAFPKIEDDYCHAPPANTWFSVEDHGFSFWSY